METQSEMDSNITTAGITPWDHLEEKAEQEAPPTLAI
jgi:hypothetical protein